MRLGTVWLAVTLALAFVRLLSEIPGRDKRKSNDQNLWMVLGEVACKWRTFPGMI